MIYEFQYHKDELIDVRHVLDDGTPRGRFGEPKPWGSGEVGGNFRIEKRQLSREDGEKFRLSAKAHEGGMAEDGELSDDVLLGIVLERAKDDGFSSRLSALGVKL